MGVMIALCTPIFNPALENEKKPEKNRLPIVVCKLILKLTVLFLRFGK